MFHALCVTINIETKQKKKPTDRLIAAAVDGDDPNTRGHQIDAHTYVQLFYLKKKMDHEPN